MKPHILSAALFFGLCGTAVAWDQKPNQPIAACAAQVPYGAPVLNKPNTVVLCHTAYAVQHDNAAKIPAWVAYTLTPQHAIGCVARTNAFVANNILGASSAKPSDYAGTGYDQGHLAPDGDMSWDVQVEYESFLMTNMSPQAGSLNRGIWKLLETSVRGWAVQRNQSYTIYVGGVYDANDKKIGQGVVVPHGFYKIVINNQTNEVAGWAFPHVAPYPNLGNDLTKFRLPIAQIEAAGGVKFAFPPNAKELQPGQEWPVDFGALTNSKRQKCGANASAD